MAELSAVPFDKLPSSHDGYTVLYDNGAVHQSDAKLSELVQSAVDESVKDKLDTSAFSEVSGTFLTAVDLSDYYTKSETSGKNEISAAFDLKEDKTFVAVYGTTTFDEIKTAYDAGKQIVLQVSGMPSFQYAKLVEYFALTSPAASFMFSMTYGKGYIKTYSINSNNVWSEVFNQKLAIDSWKGISEQKGSSGTLTGDDFCVYVGSANSGFNDSYTLGRDNYSKQGVNIGYDNKIEVDTAEILPGNVNIGKWNLVDGAGGINIGQSNSAKYFGINIGEASTAYSGGYNFGSTNSAFINSVSIGKRNYATNVSYTLGYCNTASRNSVGIGECNTANEVSYAIGYYNNASYNSYSVGACNTANSCGYTYGQNNSAQYIGIAIGQACSAKNGSVALGVNNNTVAGSFGVGKAIKATDGSIALGDSIYAASGSIACGVTATAVDGSISIGGTNQSISGSTVVGNRNNAFRASQIFGIGNIAYTGSSIVGFNNTACFATVAGNDNSINMEGSNYPETYTKPTMPYAAPDFIQIKSFVAGLGNNALYAKNAYILGHYNQITDRMDYGNTANDGFTFIYGMRNSADRNWDMAIGFKSIASGGENIAIGVPFNSIVAAYTNDATQTATINPVAHGYKNFVLRGNVSGISNTAINSNLTGNYVTDSDLSNVVNNSLINSFVQAITVKEVDYDGDHYYTTGYLLNNSFKNSRVLLTAVNVNNNKFMNDHNVSVRSDNGFNFNNFWHNKTVDLSGTNISKNIFMNNERMHIESPDICRNFIMNMLPDYSNESNDFTATKLFTDNFMVKTIIATGSNTLSSVNENFMFNTRIDPSNVTAYRGWGTNNDANTTLTRNFLVGSYVGKYVYGTVSFADNSDRHTDSGKISNADRIFNFGDNTINKAANSLVFGTKNTIAAIAKSFVFGNSNRVEKTHLNDNTDEYLDNIFLFGEENKLINDNTTKYGALFVRNRVLGIKNFVKASDRINDNTIIGNNNSINYNVTIPTKSTVISNAIVPSNPTSDSTLQSAAFATYRNYILGNCNRVSQCITDSLIVGAGNYAFDTTVQTPSQTADYNSMYVLGVANIAYDGSNQLNIGYNNETSGHFAEAIGDGVIANGQQLIVGKCNAIVDNTNRYSIEYDTSTSAIVNIEQSGVIFAIGNGTYDYATGTDNWGYTVYYDKNKNVIPTADINNEQYITRSNAFTVSANGVVSANNYKTSAGYVITEADINPINTLIQQLEAKITSLETIISANSANWVLTSQA